MKQYARSHHLIGLTEFYRHHGSCNLAAFTSARRPDSLVASRRISAANRLTYSDTVYIGSKAVVTCNKTFFATPYVRLESGASSP